MVALQDRKEREEQKSCTPEVAFLARARQNAFPQRVRDTGQALRGSEWQQRRARNSGWNVARVADDRRSNASAASFLWACDMRSKEDAKPRAKWPAAKKCVFAPPQALVCNPVDLRMGLLEA